MHATFPEASDSISVRMRHRKLPTNTEGRGGTFGQIMASGIRQRAGRRKAPTTSKVGGAVRAVTAQGMGRAWLAKRHPDFRRCLLAAGDVCQPHEAPSPPPQGAGRMQMAHLPPVGENPPCGNWNPAHYHHPAHISHVGVNNGALAKSGDSAKFGVGLNPRFAPPLKICNVPRIRPSCHEFASLRNPHPPG